MTALPDDWRGYFVRRDENRVVTEASRRPQPGRAEEPLVETHPDVLAFFARINAEPVKQPDPEIEAIKSRLDTLERTRDGSARHLL